MEISRLVILVIATLLVVMWIVLALKYEEEFRALTDSIDPEQYRYPELFCVGFALMKLLHIDSKSKKARKRIKEISEVQGKRYAEYYFYIINGAKWTYGYTALVGFAVLGALGNSMEALLFGVLLAGLLMWYIEELMNDKLQERREALLTELPQMLSKMTLLVNSGMVIRDAWRKVANGTDGVLTREMRITVDEMNNGVSELDAYRNFAERCSIKEIKRFSSTMIQNMQKGNAEIAFFLKEMSDDMWEEKKHMVKRKGEAANSKLLLPTALIFVGILILIMVPAFMNM